MCFTQDLLRYDNFKNIFYKYPSISFYLDMESRAFAYLLINESSLSSTILTYSRYIWGCLWLYSAGYESAKSINEDTCIVAAGIGTTYAKDTYIGSTYTISTWIGYTDIKGTYTRGICARSAFVKDFVLRVLAGLGVNDYGL